MSMLTEESFEGVSLADQWQRVHSLARAWRTYTDGRPPKQQSGPPAADGKKRIPAWKKKKQLPSRSADEDVQQYCYDDY